MSDRTRIVNFDRDEMAELLGLETDEGIDRIEVSFSPMMQEWSLVIDFDEISSLEANDDQA